MRYSQQRGFSVSIIATEVCVDRGKKKKYTETEN